jgi:nickel-dependent lactate racemase
MDAVRDWERLLVGVGAVTAAPIPPDVRGDDDHARAMEAGGIRAFLRGRRGGPITVVVNDTHRVTDTRPFLAALLAAIDAEFALETKPGLRMLVAAGTHKSSRFERSAHEERMAAPFLKRFDEIRWHDADATGDLVTIDGFEFHRWMGEGGSYVACGSLEPHYFAGVTGAHKTLTVGVMSRRGIEANHQGAMSAESGCLRLEGNPVHDGVVAALGALERNGARLFAVDQLVVDGRFAALTAGHPLEALERGLPLVRACFAHAISKPLDLLVACVAPPLDRDFYQAEKGIKNSEHAVRDGGVVVLDAACTHGIGIDHFVELLRAAPTHRAALDVVAARGYRLGDHKAVKLRALTDTRGVRVGVVTTQIDRTMAEVLGVRVFETREAAAQWARSSLPASGVNALVAADAGNLAVEVRA